VPKAESGWDCTLGALDRYYERALTQPTEGRKLPLVVRQPLIQLTRQELPVEVPEVVGTYLESARLLGSRTAALHLALAAGTSNPDFAPEPITTFYQRGLYQAMRNTARQSLHKLRDELPGLPESVRLPGTLVLEREADILKRLQSLLALRFSAVRIRCHGDYSLGRVLHTGKDFAIVDFDGNPAQGISHRRLKRQVLRDVAGMLCSFRYAADLSLTRQSALGRLPNGQRDVLVPWANHWRLWVSVAFLKGYLDAAGHSNLLPGSDDALQGLLEIHVLDRLLDELGDHLVAGPELVRPACEGILQSLQPGSSV
jgi:maltose alpha-D-glucosyltransferase/alpha-amylase